MVNLKIFLLKLDPDALRRDRTGWVDCSAVRSKHGSGRLCGGSTRAQPRLSCHPGPRAGISALGVSWEKAYPQGSERGVIL